MSFRPAGGGRVLEFDDPTIQVLDKNVEVRDRGDSGVVSWEYDVAGFGSMLRGGVLFGA